MKMSQEKEFGLFIALILLAVGLWRLYEGGPHAWYWIAVAVSLAIATALFPRIWAPVLRVWMPIAHLLGWINTRIILGAVFFIMIVPMAGLMRLFGYDPLHLRKRRNNSDWVKRDKDWPPASFKEPF